MRNWWRQRRTARFTPWEEWSRPCTLLPFSNGALRWSGITPNLAVQLSYVGSEAYHTMIPMNLNAPHSQVCTNAAGCLSGGVGRPVVPVPQGTTYNAPTGTCAGSLGTP